MLSRFGLKKRYIEISIQIDLQEKDNFNYKEHRKGEGKNLTRFRQLFKVISWPEHNQPNYVFAFQHLSQQDDIFLKESDKIFSFEEGFINYQLIAIFEATAVRVESLKDKGKYREQVRLSAIEGRGFDSKIVVGSFKQGIKAQEGDVILTGRKHFLFFQIAVKFQPRLSEVIDLRSQETFEKECGICLEGGSPNGNELIRPCSCLELHVHVKCLKELIKEKLEERNNDGSGEVKCCQCRIRYLPKYILRNRKYEPLHPSYCQEPSIFYEEKDENDLQKIGFLRIPGDEEFKIGSKKGKNNLVRVERSISDAHAGIKHRNRALFVRDHESEYGTFIERKNLQFRIYERVERQIQTRNVVFGFQLQRS